MITLPELLEDPKFRDFFRTVPKTIVAKPGQKPWRLIVQRRADGPWAKKEFEKYADAFRVIAPLLRDGKLHDGTIQSRGIAFGPPQRIAKVIRNGRPVLHKSSDGTMVQKTAVVLWKPKLPADEEVHMWCTYCRRPTVFRWFHSHHLIKHSPVDGLVDLSHKRCTICGATEEFIRGTAATARPPHYDPRTAYGTRRSRR